MSAELDHKNKRPMTIDEVAERLGVTRFHVLRLISAGELPAAHVGLSGARRRTWRIFPEAFAEFVRARQEEARASGQAKRNLPRMSRSRRDRLKAAGLLEE